MSSTTNYKTKYNDLLSLNLKFVIIIANDLGPFDLTAMTIDMYDRITRVICARSTILRTPKRPQNRDFYI